MLTWTKPDERGLIFASGGKGRYRICWVGSLGYTLAGWGHDGIPMLELAPYGRLLDTLDQAKDLAAALERGKTVEGQVSGS